MGRVEKLKKSFYRAMGWTQNIVIPLFQYGMLPLVFYLGLRTVNWEKFELLDLLIPPEVIEPPPPPM